MSAEAGADGHAPIVQAPARPTPGRSRARRWLIIVLLASLPAVLARLALLAFEVDSPSMEPALRVGDRVLALADAVDPRPRELWDVAFFDRALDPSVPAGVTAVLKRVVSWGDEFVAVRDGDVWAGPDRDTLRLRAKPDDLVRELLVPVHGADGLAPPWSGPGIEADQLVTRLEAGAMLRYARTIRDGTDLPGSVSVEGSTAVRDTALLVELGDGDGGLVLQLRVGADTFGAELPASGGLRLHHNLGGGLVAEAPDVRAPAAGQRVLFWHVDGRLAVFVDEVLVLGHDLAQRAGGGPLAHNGPSLGAVGGWREIRRVEILRDIHYTADGEHGTRPGGATTPARVAPGHVFLLGDQSQSSRDSRHFGAVDLSGLLGRPWLRYGPAARRGALRSSGVP